MWIEQNIAGARERLGVAEAVVRGHHGIQIGGHGERDGLGENGVRDGRCAAAVAEVFLVRGDACAAVHERVLIHNNVGARVFNADAEHAADYEILAQRDARALTDGEAFVGVKINEVSLNEDI